MRRLLIAVAGVLGGATVGLMLAFLLVWLWFDVLHLPAPTDDPKAGLAMLAIAGPVMMLVGAIAAATWLILRDRAGRSATPAVVLGMLGLVLLVPIVALLGG